MTKFLSMIDDDNVVDDDVVDDDVVDDDVVDVDDDNDDCVLHSYTSAVQMGGSRHC